MIIRRFVAAMFLLAPLPAASQMPAGGNDWAAAQTITVEVSNFQFDPSTITLRGGQTYDLRLRNTSSGGHNFAAKEFFAATQVMKEDQAKISGGKIGLEGGQTVEVHLVAPHAGTYKVRCTHFMHSAFGMTGEIVVQ